MGRQLLGALGITALAGVLLAGAVQLASARERTYPPPDDADDAVYLTSGQTIRRLSGAYSSLAADLYWIRAIQYFGAAKRRLATEALGPAPPPLIAAVDSPEYRQLFPLLDIATTLDPRFNMAYRFGAVFLAEPQPNGPGRPDLAIALLEKGLRERPDKWEYMQDAGFVQYWYRRDYLSAAAWFDKAARVPGAPWWLKSLAATTLVQGGDRRSSRLMWEAIRQSADNDWLRNDAERRLAQLRALDEIEALQMGIDQRVVKNGASAMDWATLIRLGVLRAVPRDPRDTPYELTSDGRVQLSPTSPLFPLPEEPPAALRPAS